MDDLATPSSLTPLPHAGFLAFVSVLPLLSLGYMLHEIYDTLVTESASKLL